MMNPLVQHPPAAQSSSAIERNARRRTPARIGAGLLVVSAAAALLAACQRDPEPHEHADREKSGHEHADVEKAAEHDHGAHDHDAHAPTPVAPPGLNPVQHEMRLLHETLLEAVTAIANGDVRGVAKSLHVVHGAKEQTEAALRAGTYKPPKNGEKLARFIELDEKFHDDLVPLVVKSKENDVAGAAAALGKVLESCQGCHSEFRF